MSTVSEINAGNFDTEVLSSDLPVLVKFYAPWCGPCRAITPTIDEIAKDYAGQLKVVSMNIDDAPDTAERYNVMKIPTLMIFKGGEKMDYMVNEHQKKVITGRVDPYLS